MATLKVPTDLEKLLHLGGRGVRAAEAANPGPATVVVANVTSPKGACTKLLTPGADLLVAQEARCAAVELKEMARQQECQVVYAAEVDGCVLVAAFACCRSSASALAARPTTSSGKWAAST